MRQNIFRNGHLLPSLLEVATSHVPQNQWSAANHLTFFQSNFEIQNKNKKFFKFKRQNHAIFLVMTNSFTFQYILNKNFRIYSKGVKNLLSTVNLLQDLFQTISLCPLSKRTLNYYSTG